MEGSVSEAFSSVAGSRQRTLTSDLLYDAFYGAAVGGTIIAVFFLITDLIRGQPLFTPSLMGTVLFTGADPAGVTDVHLDMVAYYSAVHLAMFSALGAFASLLCLVTNISKRNVAVMSTLLFIMLGVGFFGADALVMGGVAAALGTPTVLLANALTALGMALFLRKAHEDE